MAHIALKDETIPGIRGLFNYNDTTAKPLKELAENLLRGPSSLSPGEREVIASYVSWKNNCFFCHTSHGAAAAVHFNKGTEFIDEIKNDFPNEKISRKLRALLLIAKKVALGGKFVLPSDIEIVKLVGVSDAEIHDTVLIAAAFCMYNRYVDGLGTSYPQDKNAYVEMGKRMAEKGYV